MDEKKSISLSSSRIFQSKSLSEEDSKICSSCCSCLTTCFKAIYASFVSSPAPNNIEERQPLLSSPPISQIESKKDSESLQPLTYTCTGSSVDDTGPCIAVNCTLKINLIKDLDYKGKIFIQEDEVKADKDLIGDFEYHSLNLSGELTLRHNAFFKPQSLSDPTGSDTVATMFYKKKSIQQGIMRWKIPTHLYTQDGIDIIKPFQVVQEFQLNNGILTISKGGKELFKTDLRGLI